MIVPARRTLVRPLPAPRRIVLPAEKVLLELEGILEKLAPEVVQARAALQLVGDGSEHAVDGVAGQPQVLLGVAAFGVAGGDGSDGESDAHDGSGEQADEGGRCPGREGTISAGELAETVADGGRPGFDRLVAQVAA